MLKRRNRLGHLKPLLSTYIRGLRGLHVSQTAHRPNPGTGPHSCIVRFKHAHPPFSRVAFILGNCALGAAVLSVAEYTNINASKTCIFFPFSSHDHLSATVQCGQGGLVGNLASPPAPKSRVRIPMMVKNFRLGGRKRRRMLESLRVGKIILHCCRGNGTAEPVSGLHMKRAPHKQGGVEKKKKCPRWVYPTLCDPGWFELYDQSTLLNKYKTLRTPKRV